MRGAATEADVVSREELYELVWSMPMVKVAEKFKVSGSYMARVCANLTVPRPERVYWAKLAVGKALDKPSLPELQPCFESAVYNEPRTAYAAALAGDCDRCAQKAQTCDKPGREGHEYYPPNPEKLLARKRP